MRALLLLGLLIAGCTPSYHGHTSGWQHHGRYQHNTIQGTRDVSRQTLSLPERARLGRIEGERKLRENLDRMRRR